MKNKKILIGLTFLALLCPIYKSATYLAFKKDYYEVCEGSKAMCNCVFKVTTKNFTTKAAKTALMDFDKTEMLMEFEEFSLRKREKINRLLNKCLEM